MPLFTLTILRKQLKKQTELAKKGLLPRTHFPNASERYESPDGRLNIFYNGRQPGGNDVIDAKDMAKEGRTLKVIGYNIREAFMRDFVEARALTHLIEDNPTYLRAYNIMADGVSLVAVFDNGAGFAQFYDIKQAEKDANKKKQGAFSNIFVVEKEITKGRAQDIRRDGATPVSLRDIDAGVYSPAGMLYYVLRTR
ncbi:hypothetical protein J4402_04630 [Candidatus Pacearchaeota archaeon]|nr:hypothetical protein [Candidatus Pacearchaeota archaeon]